MNSKELCKSRGGFDIPPHPADLRTKTTSNSPSPIPLELERGAGRVAPQGRIETSGVRRATRITLTLIFFLAACVPQPDTGSVPNPSPTAGTEIPLPTPLPTRREFEPGELVAYTAQNGDTLPALASRFNTTVAQILEANPIIPSDVTTLPAGLPMEIPIYYRTFWGSAYQIIPDSHFINGPATLDFDTEAFVAQHPGWLKDFTAYAGRANRSGAQVVDLVAQNFSISPRVLLALLEYQAGALSDPVLDPAKAQYPLGIENRFNAGVYLQLVRAANLLNNGYYGWRSGKLIEFDLPNGRIERPDPWQNAASVAFQYFFDKTGTMDGYTRAIGAVGIAQTYQDLFGDPWEADNAHIPGSLLQPEFRLPFQTGEIWAFTGGPHTGWGNGEPLAALDFAPPSLAGGCRPSDLWITAVAPGRVVRSEEAVVVLDLDGDGDERTGWVIFYLHVETRGRVQAGAQLQAGDRIGHPSCEGGESTGTHAHLARKYNGEWIAAAGALPFVMEGWVPYEGDVIYAGTLVRFERIVSACVCSTQETFIQSEAANSGDAQTP